MAIVKYFYSPEAFTTSGGKIEYDRLTNQVQGTQFPTYNAERFKSGVDIYASRALTDEEKTELDALISSHTGEPIEFLSKENSDEKRRKIQDILATAVDRPDLAPALPQIRAYFKYRNPAVDNHIYFGGTMDLVDLIQADSADGEPFAELLNTVVTPSDGTTAAMFFIGKITGAV